MQRFVTQKFLTSGQKQSEHGGHIETTSGLLLEPRASVLNTLWRFSGERKTTWMEHCRIANAFREQSLKEKRLAHSQLNHAIALAVKSRPRHWEAEAFVV